MIGSSKGDVLDGKAIFVQHVVFWIKVSPNRLCKASEPKRLEAPQGALCLTQGTSRYLMSPQGTFCHLKAPWISRYLQFQGTFEVPVADPARYLQYEGTLISKVPSVKGIFSQGTLIKVPWNQGALRCLKVIMFFEVPWNEMYLEVP